MLDSHLLIESQQILDQEEQASERLDKIFASVLQVTADLRGIAEADLEGVADDVRDAVLAARGRLVEILRREGAVLFGAAGDAIDPRRHIILEAREPAHHPAIVLEVRCEGMERASRIVRKASVIVSKTPSTQDVTP